MATGADTNKLAEGQVVYDEHGERKEKPSIEYIYISDNKLKYINNRYEKVNAKMYDYKSDVKLKVGQSNFKGHRSVLAEASDYFAAMFSHEMKEKDETVIELKDISPEGFGAMLDYFYHGHVTVEDKIVPDILEAARFFHVDWILDVCCDYMIRHLSLLDYPLTMHLCDTFALGDLRWDIFKYFGHNLPSLYEKENFLRDLSFDLLLQFLMEYMYIEVSEFFLLQVILNWVKVDEDSRKEQCLPLLRQLRFHTMDLEELEELPVEVLEYPEIKAEVEDAKDYTLNVAAQCLKTGDKYLSRGSRPTVMLSLFNDDGESNVVVYKDPFNDEADLFIEQLGPSGLACDYSTMGIAKVGNFLFAAGGYNEDYVSSPRVFRYDPRFREWTEMAIMSEGRVSFALCSSIDRLYAIGGVYHRIGDIDNGEAILSSVEMYIPDENVWRSRANLPHGIFDLAAVHAETTTYISGGISDLPQLTIPLKSMFCLEESSESWTPLPDMLIARQGHSMTHHANKIIVIGGYTSNPEAVGFHDCVNNDIFDLLTRQWTSLVSTPETYGHLYRHVGYIENKIFFLCNNDTDVYLRSYNIDKQEFDDGVLVGIGVQKVSILEVAYPHT